MKDKLKSAAIVLSSVTDGKVSLIAGVTADTTARVKAGELVNFVAQQVGGKGGGQTGHGDGRRHRTSASGSCPASVTGWVKAKL
ncbi:MAG: DHHA1 domain-containing protein [Nitrosomonadales bacterium]